MPSPFPEYPELIKYNSSTPNRIYARVPDEVFIVGHVPPGVSVVTRIRGSEGEFSVCRDHDGTLASKLGSSKIGPIYAIEPNGPPAVPTGLIFVRFEGEFRPKFWRKRLAEAGYKVVRELPGVICVGAISGHVPDALQGIARLESLPDVANVEPQMLMERVRRGSAKQR